jgi:hypothetical protein
MITVELQALTCDRLGDCDGQVTIHKLAGDVASQLAGPLTFTANGQVVPAPRTRPRRGDPPPPLPVTAELEAGDRIVLKDGAGQPIGEPWQPPADPDAPYPWFRRGAAPGGALFTLRVSIEVTPETTPTEEGCADGCGAISASDTPPVIHSARGVGTTVAVPADDPRTWPKYATVWLEEVLRPRTSRDRNREDAEGHPGMVTDTVSHTQLYRPASGTITDLTDAERRQFYALTYPELPPPGDPSLGEYPEDRLRSMRGPFRDSPVTWGRRTVLRLPVCTLEGTRRQERTLRFREDGPRWEFTIYNLETGDGYFPQPLWVPCLKRSLMRIPLEHLCWARLRGVYLNFRVGSPFVNGNIGTGGSNLPNRDDLEPTQNIVDRSVLAVVCCTYSAINRAWAQQGDVPRRPRDEQAIDDAFRSPTVLMDTILHEFGHVLDLTDPVVGGDFALASGFDAEAVRLDWQAVSSGNGHATAHDAYKAAIHYSGSTQGSSEGFAEAYRKRISGDSLGGGRAGDAVADLLDAAGFPSLDSVRAASEEIAAFVARAPQRLRYD